LNYFGYGRGYLPDLLRRQNDRKAVLAHLGLEGDQLLMWDYAGIEICRPKFFVVWDERVQAIVITFRGTVVSF